MKKNDIKGLITNPSFKIKIYLKFAKDNKKLADLSFDNIFVTCIHLVQHFNIILWHFIDHSVPKTNQELYEHFGALIISQYYQTTHTAHIYSSIILTFAFKYMKI